MITRETVIERIVDYMNGAADLVQLVEWAEDVIIDTPVDEARTHDILAYIAAADVDGFPLGWSECHEFLNQLDAKVQVVRE